MAFINHWYKKHNFFGWHILGQKATEKCDDKTDWFAYNVFMKEAHSLVSESVPCSYL